ncbi:uncharacterized protein [Dermacentor andersoni]|uniref:uncharacterized protein n=1 Tax=Dermacentor andersoni TaxID=34620 RepID=UPI003B3AD2DB
MNSHSTHAHAAVHCIYAFQLSPQRAIISSKCTCKAGLGKCKHAAAVVLWVNEFQPASCTELPQTWGRPSQRPNIDAEESIEELFGRKFYHSSSGFFYTSTLQPLPAVCRYRNHHVEALLLGRKTEAVAREQFEQKTGGPVLQVGLIVHLKQPWLCASPDGLFKYGDQTTLLEIKCPYSRKDDVLSDHTKESSFIRYIVYRDGHLEVNKRHQYYTQMQITMHVTSTTMCVFFVYSSKQTVTIVVERDEHFLSEAIPRLEHFYFNFYNQHLV